MKNEKKQKMLFDTAEIQTDGQNTRTTFTIGIPTNLSIRLDIARGKTTKSAWISEAIEEKLQKIDSEINLHEEIKRIDLEIVNLKKVIDLQSSLD